MSDNRELPEQSEASEFSEITDTVPCQLLAVPLLSEDSPGRSLREAREARGLSIADVAQSIKFSPRQIETIERDDYAKLPGATFVRGFIRSYAKLLHLEEQSLLTMLDRQTPQEDVQIQLPQDTGAALPQAGEQRKYYSLLIVLAILMSLVAAFAIYHEWSGKTEKSISSSSNAVPTVQPPLAYIEQPAATRVDPNQPAPQISPSPGPDIRQLIFVFEDKSWVEVKDATQRVIFAQNNEPGTRQVVNGKPPFALVIGNASRVQLQFEEQQIDLRPHTKVDVARLTLE
ncbi:MAG: DUF4115 domain-containing protein [Sterolibacterium sp.]|nr:DUF4115 domain-containing protein [Sterolibacterium sp.]